MAGWTKEHGKFVGRIIFANLLKYPLEKYARFIEGTESSPLFDKLGVKFKRLSRGKICGRPKGFSNRTVAEIAKNGKNFSIRYACEGFNGVCLVDRLLGRMISASSCTNGRSYAIQSTLFRLRRIGSRNSLTHEILKGIIQHQKKYLKTGNPIDLVPFSQVQLTTYLNRGSNADTCKSNPKREFRNSKQIRISKFKCSKCAVLNFGDSNLGFVSDFDIRISNFNRVCNTWVSRLVGGLSIITPFGEERSLKSFFQTQKDINKRLIKQILDQESEDLKSGKLKKPYTDNELRKLLEALLLERVAHSVERIDNKKLNAKRYPLSTNRWTIGNCRKAMGIPPFKKRLSGYKYPPLSANFSAVYPLTPESIQSNIPANSGVYEFRLKSGEIEYRNGKSPVIYIGTTRDLKKRLREHLGRNSKNGRIRGFLREFECSIRYIMYDRDWRKEEKRLYKLFVDTYGSGPRCNRVRP